MTVLNATEDLALPQAAPAVQHLTRPFLWSIRRELWESPSLVIAPVAVAVIEIIAFVVGAIRHGSELFEFQAASPDHSLALALLPFLALVITLGLTAFLTGMVYSLDALYSERRDRSILFWKSLPVSDTTTVLAKASIPLLFLPALAFAVTIAAELLLLLICVPILLVKGVPFHLLFANLPLFNVLLTVCYGFIVSILWYAPLYAWMLLVSAWAKRSALVWAILPFVLLALFEKFAFHTRYLVDFFKSRLNGQFQLAFAPVSQQDGITALSNLTPAHFFLNPGLWLGLLAAAALLYACIRSRRDRNPI